MPPIVRLFIYLRHAHERVFGVAPALVRHVALSRVQCCQPRVVNHHLPTGSNHVIGVTSADVRYYAFTATFVPTIGCAE